MHATIKSRIALLFKILRMYSIEFHHAFDIVEMVAVSVYEAFLITEYVLVAAQTLKDRFPTHLRRHRP